MSEARNLILAVVTSVTIMIGWKFVYEKFLVDKHVTETAYDMESLIPEVDDVVEHRSYSDAIELVPRVKLRNSRVSASVSLNGAYVDDVSLTNYLVSLEDNAESVRLMSPEGTMEDSLVAFGWVDPKNNIKVPRSDTVWDVDTDNEGECCAVKWDNGEGLVFKIRFALDQNYMFTVTQEVENNTESDITLAHYGRINRTHGKDKKSFWISHEGAIGSFGNGVKEWTYKDIEESGSIRLSGIASGDSGHSWIGFADKYWFSALIPVDPQDRKVAYRAQNLRRDGVNRYQVDFSRSHGVIKAHSTARAVTNLFIGAKELDLLDKYKAELNIPLFDKAVDFGMLYFVTKPVFLLLQYFNKILGNFGLAIVMLTVTIKLAVFPLSLRSYVSMFKLKKLQPEIARIKELFKSDDLRASKEIAALLKKHQVSPLSGFLPVLAQIPVFFALYKVLFVTIEMRHAPLFGWIKDLSTQDSANLLNFFGMIPFQPPICIGVLPVILGVTMILQQKVMQKDNADHDRYGVMKFLPYIFVFIFSSFPSGLVLYWICSNVITIAQQLMVRHFVCDKDFSGSSA
ncbi:membrane protein insertase YidC [Candidatus Anaplasma sp. TIGMIC]|uniref:membrane protein insertase YidC n=1 Tax=Candidatus Anaplasma sp. TIGMIC TaxID=3020713 RepID=UPI0023310B37|nr:membrane protein insertase YidC [Candidatus Anaplasma sp. TIGMIC]MDB1135617.1 membrane protein insertase YidC [Candidatus Anaplasma sp. TIGMIC]